MTRRLRIVVPFLALPLVALAAAALHAQSAEEILATALDRYEARVADIENYTVVQEINGVEQVMYFEKRMVDGHPVFVPRADLQVPGDVPGGMGPLAGMGAGSSAASDDTDEALGFEMLMRHADRFRVTGTEVLDGHPTWVLEADDLAGLDLGDDDFEPSAIAVRLDRDEHVVRALHVEGEMDAGGERRPVSVDIRLEDYRDVRGMLHPFRTVMTFEGMGDSMSDEERAEMAGQMEEAKRQMAEMEKQLAQLPPAQRKMVEQQMERMGGLEGMQGQVEAMAAGRMEVVVKDLTVNQGPPGS